MFAVAGGHLWKSFKYHISQKQKTGYMHIYQKEKINHQASCLSEHFTVGGKHCYPPCLSKFPMTNLIRVSQQLWVQKYILVLAANVLE